MMKRFQFCGLILTGLLSPVAGADTYNFYFEKDKKPTEAGEREANPSEKTAAPPITIHNNINPPEPQHMGVMPGGGMVPAPVAVQGNGVAPVASVSTERNTFFRLGVGGGWAASRTSRYRNLLSGPSTVISAGVQSNRIGLGGSGFLLMHDTGFDFEPIAGGIEADYIPWRGDGGDFASIAGVSFFKGVGGKVDVTGHFGVRGTVYLSDNLGLQLAIRASEYFGSADFGLTLRL